jgi:hypothetical protein
MPTRRELVRLVFAPDSRGRGDGVPTERCARQGSDRRGAPALARDFL